MVRGVRPDGRGLPKASDLGYQVTLWLLCCVALCSTQLDAQSRPANLASPVVMVGTENREDDLPSLAAAPDGSLWLAWLVYSDGRDDIALRHRVDGTWGNLQYVPNTSGDSWYPQIAVDADNRAWVVWTQQVQGNWDIYARRFDAASQSWGALQRLTDHPLPDINPRVGSDGNGRIAVVWQGFRNGASNIYLRMIDGAESSRYGEDWSPVVAVTDREASEWDPAVAIDSSGTAWVAYDTYKNGNYDVYLKAVRNGLALGPEIAIAESARFEARSTVAVDRLGRVWVAYESGGPGWGKDTGYKIRERQPGVELGGSRESRIRCYVGGRVQAPMKPLQAAFDQGKGEPKWSFHPHVFSDGNSNIWVAAKRQIRVGGIGEKGELSYFEYWVTRYDGDRWTRVRPLPKSWGRLGTRVSAAVTPEGMWWSWPTDNRRPVWAQRPILGEAYAASFAAAPSGEAALATPIPERVAAPRGHIDEAGDVAAIRAYRTRIAGRPVGIVRGDLHRHTELSWDDGGVRDGSLPDLYRYALDAADLDFGASTDHQGGGYDYWWWYSRKAADMYHVPGRFTPLYGYERSLSQPNGHRNVLFADRSGWVVPFFYQEGVELFELPRHPQGDVSGIAAIDVVRDDTKHLYDEVRRMGGVTIPHTSATEQGTDWRDNDPELEPVVEIFQGARTSYESSRGPLDARIDVDDEHIRSAGYFPVGFVTEAWKKGYRLGVVASSDHHSTHYSYAMVYTDDTSREGILEAIRRRHTYAATDNILLEVRMGRHVMGDEFSTHAPLPIEVRARGTAPIANVHILRGGRILYARQPGEQQVSFAYTDSDIEEGTGTQDYYVRVEQADGHVAWSSPIWVNY